MKIMPKKIKVKNTIWKNYSLVELLVAMIIFLLVFLLFTNNKKIFSMILGITFVILYMPVGEDLFYLYIIEMLVFLFKRKKYVKKEISKILNIHSINSDGVISYNNNMYAKVLSVSQKNFLMEDIEQQDMDINYFAKTLNALELDTSIDIVQIYRPLNFVSYTKDLNERISQNNNNIKESILHARNNYINKLSKDTKEYFSNFYIVIYNTRQEELDLISDVIINEMSKCGLNLKHLPKRETALFLKYNYTRNFDEKEIDTIKDEDLIDWILPKEIIIKPSKIIVDNIDVSTITISDYPLKVNNGWGSELFDIQNTKVVMSIKPIEKYKAIKKIDKAIVELQTKEMLSNSASEAKDAKTHCDTMTELLQRLQSENENLFDVSIFISCYNYDKNRNYRRTVKNKIRGLDFKTNLLNYKQKDAFVYSNINSQNNNKYTRSINSVTLASVFPFVKNYIMDNRGIMLGKIKSNNYPFVFDMWKRGGLYQNSNSFIIGKSGSGKTYFTKNLLVNEWSNNTRIIICDPEAEYSNLVRKLDGNIIDVGSAKEGILNPFQIYKILTEDGGNADSVITFNTHLKTLESFFKIVLRGASNDVIEIINSLVVETYKYKNITEETNFELLQAIDFPIFSDLLEVLETKMETINNNFLYEKYSIAKIHLNKFVSGRYSDIWNHYSTLQANSSIISFNFQSLFANKNNIVANAQMLLVFRFIEQEIINARENNKLHNKTKTMIVVDEAHLFIDPNYPIALDFFYQMNKRIRKYDGAFVPITQNISDWNSNEELRHKTSTIIKNSKYTFIFKLSSPDMQDVIDIYKAGESFNREERKTIITANTGEVFFIGSSELRESIKIEVNKDIKTYLE